MTTKHSLRVRSRVGILIALGVVSIHVISCISSSSSGGGMSRGDAAVHSGAQCPIACSNQAADCADASALPSTATCLSSCTTEAARADSRSCGGQWDDFIGCCADANGTANCSLSSLPQLNGVNGCSASCRALLSDYNRCVAHGTGGNPMSGSDSGSGTGSDSGTHNADAGSMPSGPDAGMTHGAPDAGNLPLPSMIQIQGYRESRRCDAGHNGCERVV